MCCSLKIIHMCSSQNIVVQSNFYHILILHVPMVFSVKFLSHIIVHPRVISRVSDVLVYAYTAATSHLFSSSLFNFILGRRMMTFTSMYGTLRGFAKLKQIPKNLDRAHPTHPSTPNANFFGNPSLTWTEHSNHINQQLLAMYIDRIHMVYYSKISVLV